VITRAWASVADCCDVLAQGSGDFIDVFEVQGAGLTTAVDGLGPACEVAQLLGTGFHDDGHGTVDQVCGQLGGEVNVDVITIVAVPRGRPPASVYYCDGEPPRQA